LGGGGAMCYARDITHLQAATGRATEG